jgi:hypothetical protein
MFLDVEAMDSRYPIVHLYDSTLLHMNSQSATFADKMMVVLTRFHQLVMALAV